MKGKPLIALVTNNDDDVFCFRLELIQALLDAGYGVLISCPDGPKFGVMEGLGLRKNEAFIYDDPPIDRRGTNIFNDFRLLMHYKQLFQRKKPSIVLTFTAKPNVYASLVAHYAGIPVINNVTGLGSVVNATALKKRIILKLFQIAYRHSSCIMFQNSDNLRTAKELGWINGDYKLIPGSGVALDRFPVQEYPDGGDGINGAPVVFNYIGRILKDKGVDDYIEVAKRIKASFPQTEFNMIGFIEPTEKDYEAVLKELEKQKIVFYRGSQIDVKPWIKRAHAIIHPSMYGEGMSNVLLENASSGRMIITTDNPGCRETVNDSVSGFIYHGGDVDALEKKIISVVHAMPNSVRCQMGLEGRKLAEKKFDRRIVIKAYLDEISELIKETSEKAR